MAEETTELLNLTMSVADLTVIYKSLEKNVINSQLEYAEIEKKAQVLKNDIEKQISMLSIMRQRLQSEK